MIDFRCPGRGSAPAVCSLNRSEIAQVRQNLAYLIRLAGRLERRAQVGERRRYPADAHHASGAGELAGEDPAALGGRAA